MELDAVAAALGILRVANEHMVRALRVISVRRGLDPRDYTPVSYTHLTLPTIYSV